MEIKIYHRCGRTIWPLAERVVSIPLLIFPFPERSSWERMSTTAPAAATRIPAFLSVPTTAPSHKLLQVATCNKQVIHITKLQALCINVNHAKIPSTKLFASTSSSSPAVQQEEDEEKREDPSPSSNDDGVLLQSASFTMDQEAGSISSVRYSNHHDFVVHDFIKSFITNLAILALHCNF